VRVALFDLDGTLLPLDSDHGFGEYLVRIGWADPQEHRRRNDAFYADYLAGRLDVDAYIDFATSAWRVRDPAEVEAACRDYLDQVIRPAVHARALALVQRHRDAGDELVIVTSTHEVITRPIAALFGVTHLLATELERDGRGRVTGRIRGVACLREGKIERVQQWLAARGAALDTLESSWYYGDSMNDLPLLERVTHPVATNPGPALAEVARERGWPVLRLFE
jgi:HAD superfamily hydrolase (TIGR01490 family)